MESKTFTEIIQDLIREDDTAVFLASASHFAHRIVYVKWFLPHKYPDSKAFEKDVWRLMGNGKRLILDSQNLPADILAEASLKVIYEVSILSSKYGPEPVRGFHFHFKRLPTIKEFETFFRGPLRARSSSYTSILEKPAN